MAPNPKPFFSANPKPVFSANPKPSFSAVGYGPMAAAEDNAFSLRDRSIDLLHDLFLCLYV
jgi:hypothetical protein